jgi:hypothetical protein
MSDNSAIDSIAKSMRFATVRGDLLGIFAMGSLQPFEQLFLPAR